MSTKKKRLRPEFWVIPEVIASIKRYDDGFIPSQTALLRELRQVPGGENLHQGTLSNRLKGKRTQDRFGAPEKRKCTETDGAEVQVKTKRKRHVDANAVPTTSTHPGTAPEPLTECKQLKTRYLANNLLCVTDDSQPQSHSLPTPSPSRFGTRGRGNTTATGSGDARGSCSPMECRG